MNTQLFRRIQLQAQFRRIIEELGPDLGCQLIQEALEKELKLVLEINNSVSKCGVTNK